MRWDDRILTLHRAGTKTCAVVAHPGNVTGARWNVIFSRLTTAQNADEFYTLMGELSQDMLDGKIIDEDVLIAVQ